MRQGWMLRPSGSDRRPGDPASSLVSVAACIAVALAFAAPTFVWCWRGGCLPTWNRPSETDDTRQFLMMWEVSRVSLSTFGELPSWNPYHCGGVVHFLDPQVPFPGPLFFLLFFWAPAVFAIKLWNLAHLVAGALGARKLAEESGANVPEQVLAAALIVAPGAVAEHLGGGQLWYTPFLLLPWALWAHRRALRDARWELLAAAILALSVLEGGVYPVPLGLATLLFDSLLRLGDAQDRRALARALPLLAVAFPLLAAVKLVPVLLFLRRVPRLTALDDRMGLGELVQAWTTPEHARAFPPHVYVWPEYDDYIGIAPLVVAAAGALVSWRSRERRIDLLLCALLLWCALGNVPGLPLFRLLHTLPIFRSLRVPSRFLYPATVLLGLLCVHALVSLRRSLLLRPSLVAAFEIVLALGVAANLAFTNGARLQQGAGPPVPLAPASDAFYQRASVDYRQLPFFPQRAIGTPICYGGFDWPVSNALWFGPGPQQRLDPSDAGSVSQVRWSPNELRFRVALRAPATLTVDQNWDPGWRPSEGIAAERSGLLAVSLGAGDREVVLRHRPAGFAAGLALTLAGIAGCAVALRLMAKPSALS